MVPSLIPESTRIYIYFFYVFFLKSIHFNACRGQVFKNEFEIYFYYEISIYHKILSEHVPNCCLLSMYYRGKIP